MTDDAELLRRYVEHHSDADFTEFVRRHFSFVYHAALRRTGGRGDLAEEAAQYVFTAVAHQARALRHHRVLAGWLHTTTRNAVDNLFRAERRRAQREQEAILMSDPPSTEPTPELNRIRREIDYLMDELPERDREAILLRFFHGRPFAQIGAAFGLSEEAARKRVERALNRLRETLARRGIRSTSAALGAMLSGEAALAAPAGLASSVAGAALMQAAGLGGATLGAISIMTTKTMLDVAGAVGLAAIVTMTAIYQTQEARQAKAALASAQRHHQVEVARLAQLQQNAQDVDARVAEAQAAVEKLRAATLSRTVSNAPTPAAAPSPPTRIKGRQLLDAIGPARAAFTESLRNGGANSGRYFARLANFTPAQFEEFENRVVAYALKTMEFFPEGNWTINGRLPDKEMRELFGDEVAQKFSSYVRMTWAYSIATDAALAMADAGLHPSDDQAERIARAIAANNDLYRSGKFMTLASLNTAAQNWDGVIAEAKEVLSPEQWAAAEGVFARQRFQHALEQARQAMMAAAPAKPKS